MRFFYATDVLISPIRIIEERMHYMCESSVGQTTRWRTVYQSLVCGCPFSPDENVENLQKLGLIHMFVVSGSHLILIFTLLSSVFLRFRIWGRSVLWVTVIAYCWICQSQPPVLRSLIQISLSEICDRRKWFWSPPYRILWASCVCLFLFPSLVLSFSFQLSWVASLAQQQSFQRSYLRAKGLRREVLTCLRSYFYLLIPLSSLAGLNPVSILANLFVAPLFEIFLFPLVLIASPFSLLQRWIDAPLDWFFLLISQWGRNLPYPEPSDWFFIFQRGSWTLTVAIAAFNVFLCHRETQQCRSQLF